jgi:transcriptional regulator GlxA family with amidase domain
MISPMATVIDFAGPWEVFQDAGYARFIVSKNRDLVEATKGLQVLHDYTFDDTTHPDLLFICPRRRRKLPWLRRVAPKADVMMSVCTGAFS